MIYSYNPSTREVGGLGVQGHSWVPTKLEASLGYTKPYLKKHKIFSKNYFIVLCCVFFLCVFLYTTRVHECQRRELDPTEMVVSHCGC